MLTRRRLASSKLKSWDNRQPFNPNHTLIRTTNKLRIIMASLEDLPNQIILITWISKGEQQANSFSIRTVKPPTMGWFTTRHSTRTKKNKPIQSTPQTILVKGSKILYHRFNQATMPSMFWLRSSVTIFWIKATTNRHQSKFDPPTTVSAASKAQYQGQTRHNWLNFKSHQTLKIRFCQTNKQIQRTPCSSIQWWTK